MRTREEQEAINKACIYHPKTKEELQKLVDDPKVDLRKIDTSKITDMSGMFYCCDGFNQDISSWDVSSVKDMSHMFWGVFSKNQISIIGRDLDYMARELEQTKSKTSVLRQ